MQRSCASRGGIATSVRAGIFLALCAETAAGARFSARQNLRGHAGVRSPSRVAWDYNQHGADWTGMCATDMSQSPISIPPLVSLSNSTDTLWYRYPQRWEEPVVLYNDGLGLSTTFHKKVRRADMWISIENSR